MEIYVEVLPSIFACDLTKKNVQIIPKKKKKKPLIVQRCK